MSSQVPGNSVSIVLSSSEIDNDPILESFVHYYSTLAKGRSEPSAFNTNNNRGVSAIASPSIERKVPSGDQGAGAGRGRSEGSDTYLKNLVKLLASEVEQTRAASSGRVVALAEALTQFRAETDVTDVYKGRIVDLQKVINGTKLPGELDALIGRQEMLVPAGADSTASQQQRESLHEVSRLAGRVTDVNERLRAQNSMLTTQVSGLLAENALLMDRIALLEEQVSALGNSAAVTMRALNKARIGVAAAGGGPSTQRSVSTSRVIKGNETLVGGVPMDRETALWLREVYNQLSKGAAVDDAIRMVGVGGRGAPNRPLSTSSSTQRGSSRPKCVTPFAQYVEGNRSVMGPVEDSIREVE